MKENILKNVQWRSMATVNSLATNILQNIFFRAFMKCIMGYFLNYT